MFGQDPAPRWTCSGTYPLPLEHVRARTPFNQVWACTPLLPVNQNITIYSHYSCLKTHRKIFNLSTSNVIWRFCPNPKSVFWMLSEDFVRIQSQFFECYLKILSESKVSFLIQTSPEFLKMKLKTRLNHLQYEYQLTSFIELSNIAA